MAVQESLGCAFDFIVLIIPVGFSCEGEYTVKLAAVFICLLFLELIVLCFELNPLQTAVCFWLGSLFQLLCNV